MQYITVLESVVFVTNVSAIGISVKTHPYRCTSSSVTGDSNVMVLYQMVSNVAMKDILHW